MHRYTSLIAAPAHEFSALLMVLKYAQMTSTQVDRKTVRSLNTGLCLPANRWITSYFARASCTYAWPCWEPSPHMWKSEVSICAGLNRSSVVPWRYSSMANTRRQPYEERWECAYHNLTGFVHFLPESLFQATLQSLEQVLCSTCKDGTKTQVTKAHVDMVSAIGYLIILEMLTFEAANTSSPIVMCSTTCRWWWSCWHSLEVSRTETGQYVW